VTYLCFSAVFTWLHCRPCETRATQTPDAGRSFREIVPQQWNFSPPNSIREVEEYRVEISDVTVLELVIVSDISRGAGRASLKSLRLC
jgi:hypothetical protein